MERAARRVIGDSHHEAHAFDTFLDLRKVFETVDREFLAEAVGHEGYPAHAFQMSTATALGH